MQLPPVSEKSIAKYWDDKATECVRIATEIWSVQLKVQRDRLQKSKASPDALEPYLSSSPEPPLYVRLRDGATATNHYTAYEKTLQAIHVESLTADGQDKTRPKPKPRYPDVTEVPVTGAELRAYVIAHDIRTWPQMRPARTSQPVQPRPSAASSHERPPTRAESLAARGHTDFAWSNQATPIPAAFRAPPEP